jgi:UDP-N-acetylglucosamine 3-dehydrogenase
MKTGVIGTGSMGQNHVRVYSEMENVELVGIADRDTARVRKLAKTYDTTPYNDYKTLLEQRNRSGSDGERNPHLS